MGDELVKTDGMLLDKCCIIEFLVDDDVHHGQGKGPVRPRPYLEVHLCLVCHGNPLGIDDHQPGPFFHVFLYGHPQGKV